MLNLTAAQEPADSSAPHSTRAIDLAIIGDGLAGLACAHYALRAGRIPLVISAPEPGRERLSALNHHGVRIDAFHSPLHTSDTSLLGLLNDLGQSDRVHWRSLCSRRVDAAPPADRWLRLRARIAEAMVCKGHRRRHTKSVLARLRRIAGHQAFEHGLRPRLEAVLGPIDSSAPAFAARAALDETREKTRERLGSVRGGWSHVAAVLRARIQRAGGVFWAPVTLPRLRIERDGVELVGRRTLRVPVAISTIASSDLRCASGEALASSDSHRQDVTSICMVGRGLKLGAYRSMGLDGTGRFYAFTQADALSSLSETRGASLIYTERRTAHGMLHEPADVVVKQALDALHSLVPGFDSARLENVWISTARGTERVPQRSDRPPAPIERPAAGPLFLAGAAGSGAPPFRLESSVAIARDAMQRALRALV